MIFEAMCTDDIDISVSGVVSIIDLKGVGMGHAMQMTPAFIRKAVSSWQVELIQIEFLKSDMNF